MVRDLNALQQDRPLAAYDAEALRKSLEALCQEWAAVEQVSVAEASAEVAGLLRAALPHEPPPASKA